LGIWHCAFLLKISLAGLGFLSALDDLIASESLLGVEAGWRSGLRRNRDLGEETIFLDFGFVGPKSFAAVSVASLFMGLLPLSSFGHALTEGLSGFCGNGRPS
jgi:hypothetical protein